MRDFDYRDAPKKLLTPEILKLFAQLYEHKGKQELFIEANIDEVKTLSNVALIQSKSS